MYLGSCCDIFETTQRDPFGTLDPEALLGVLKEVKQAEDVSILLRIEMINYGRSKSRLEVFRRNTCFRASRRQI